MQLINDFEHIIWDWNGTLLDDVDYCRSIINTILIKNNLPQLSFDRYREVFTFPVQDYYKAAGFDFNKVSFEILGKEFMVGYEKNRLSCSLYPQVFNVLTAIMESDRKQSVLSAYKEDALISILQHYKLFDYFDHIVGSDNIYAGSKMQQGMDLIKKLGIDKNKILFIGDTLHDYDVANGMGVKSILVANGHQSKERLTSNGAFVLDNMEELVQYLFNSNK